MDVPIDPCCGQWRFHDSRPVHGCPQTPVCGPGMADQVGPIQIIAKTVFSYSILLYQGCRRFLAF